MILELNAGKVVRLFAPLWLLLALALAVDWADWMRAPAILAYVALLPLVMGAVAWTIRGRWRLEFRPEGLAHKTLAREEVFDWRLLGPISVQGAPVLELAWFRTLAFPYPYEPGSRDVSLVRRLLPVFGDLSAARTAELIGQQQALWAAAPERRASFVAGAGAPPPQRLRVNLTKLVRRWTWAFFAVGAALALLAEVWPEARSRPALIAAALALVVGLWGWSRMSWLELTPDALVIQGPFRRREIRWDVITSAALARTFSIFPSPGRSILLAFQENGRPARARLPDVYGDEPSEMFVRTLTARAEQSRLPTASRRAEAINPPGS